MVSGGMPMDLLSFEDNQGRISTHNHYDVPRLSSVSPSSSRESAWDGDEDGALSPMAGNVAKGKDVMFRRHSEPADCSSAPQGIQFKENQRRTLQDAVQLDSLDLSTEQILPQLTSGTRSAPFLDRRQSKQESIGAGLVGSLVDVGSIQPHPARSFMLQQNSITRSLERRSAVWNEALISAEDLLASIPFSDEEDADGSLEDEEINNLQVFGVKPTSLNAGGAAELGVNESIGGFSVWRHRDVRILKTDDVTHAEVVAPAEEEEPKRSKSVDTSIKSSDEIELPKEVDQELQKALDETLEQLEAVTTELGVAKEEILMLKEERVKGVQDIAELQSQRDELILQVKNMQQDMTEFKKRAERHESNEARLRDTLFTTELQRDAALMQFHIDGTAMAMRIEELEEEIAKRDQRKTSVKIARMFQRRSGSKSESNTPTNQHSDSAYDLESPTGHNWQSYGSGTNRVVGAPSLSILMEHLEMCKNSASLIEPQDILRMQLERTRLQYEEMEADYEALFAERKAMQETIAMLRDGGVNPTDVCFEPITPIVGANMQLMSSEEYTCTTRKHADSVDGMRRSSADLLRRVADQRSSTFDGGVPAASTRSLTPVSPQLTRTNSVPPRGTPKFTEHRTLLDPSPPASPKRPPPLMHVLSQELFEVHGTTPHDDVKAANNSNIYERRALRMSERNAHEKKRDADHGATSSNTHVPSTPSSAHHASTSLANAAPAVNMAPPPANLHARDLPLSSSTGDHMLSTAPRDHTLSASISSHPQVSPIVASHMRMQLQSPPPHVAGIAANVGSTPTHRGNSPTQVADLASQIEHSKTQTGSNALLVDHKVEQYSVSDVQLIGKAALLSCSSPAHASRLAAQSPKALKIFEGVVEALGVGSPASVKPMSLTTSPSVAEAQALTPAMKNARGSDAAVKSEAAMAAMKSEAAMAAVKSETATAAVKSEAATAAVKSEAATSAVKSEAATAAVKSEAATAAVKSEAATAAPAPATPPTPSHGARVLPLSHMLGSPPPVSIASPNSEAPTTAPMPLTSSPSASQPISPSKKHHYRLPVSPSASPVRPPGPPPRPTHALPPVPPPHSPSHPSPAAASDTLMTAKVKPSHPPPPLPTSPQTPSKPVYPPPPPPDVPAIASTPRHGQSPEVGLGASQRSSPLPSPSGSAESSPSLRPSLSSPSARGVPPVPGRRRMYSIEPLSPAARIAAAGVIPPPLSANNDDDAVGGGQTCIAFDRFKLEGSSVSRGRATGPS